MTPPPPDAPPRLPPPIEDAIHALTDAHRKAAEADATGEDVHVYRLHVAACDEAYCKLVSAILAALSPPRNTLRREVEKLAEEMSAEAAGVVHYHGLTAYGETEPCRVVEYDGAFKCLTHQNRWGAITNPDEPCAPPAAPPAEARTPEAP